MLCSAEIFLLNWKGIPPPLLYFHSVWNFLSNSQCLLAGVVMSVNVLVFWYDFFQPIFLQSPWMPTLLCLKKCPRKGFSIWNFILGFKRSIGGKTDYSPLENLLQRERQGITVIMWLACNKISAKTPLSTTTAPPFETFWKQNLFHQIEWKETYEAIWRSTTLLTQGTEI